MADKTGIRLLGFKGFEASERFLRSLDDEIWVARWDRTVVPVHRPEDLADGDAMQAELARPSLITVASMHAWRSGSELGFCGEDEDGKSELPLTSIRTIGATSMLLIDACYAPDLADALTGKAQAGSLIVGLDAEPDEDQVTRGKDSVAALADVIRELCYPSRPALSPEECSRAVNLANAKITARNAERGRMARRPLLFKREC